MIEAIHTVTKRWNAHQTLAMAYAVVLFTVIGLAVAAFTHSTVQLCNLVSTRFHSGLSFVILAA